MIHAQLPLPLWQLTQERRRVGAFFVSFVLVAVLSALALMGCQGCGAHPSLPTTPRAQARATILVLAGAIVEARKVCADVVERKGDLPLGEKCLAAYDASRDALLIAGGAVDAYDEGRRGDTACATARGAEAAGTLASLVESGGGTVPTALTDGLALYRTLMAGACTSPSDGGAS